MLKACDVYCAAAEVGSAPTRKAVAPFHGPLHFLQDQAPPLTLEPKLLMFGFVSCPVGKLSSRGDDLIVLCIHQLASL